jgi:hypothetical protein
MEKKCSLLEGMDLHSDNFLRLLALLGSTRHCMLLILRIKGFVVSDYLQIKKKATYLKYMANSNNN